MCENLSSSDKTTQPQQHAFKFQEFHTSLNEILVQLPYVNAARLTLDCMERASAALEEFTSNQMKE